MRIEYSKLFKVDIHHDYYSDVISKDFEIEPTDICKWQLANYGLIFKKMKDGFIVLYETDNSNTPHPKREFDNSVKFSFKLIPKKLHVVNYSNLSHTSKSNQIYYLHNLNNNRQNINGVDFLLLNDNAGGFFLSSRDQIIIKPHFFQYREDNAALSAVVEIDGDSGNVIPARNVLVIEGILNYTVNLRHHEPGKYTLKVNGENRLVFYACDELKTDNIFGIIDIYCHPDMNNDYAFVMQNGDISAKIYTLRIQRRETIWRYFLVLKNRPNADDLSINYSNGPVIFAAQPEEILSDGQRAVPFISSVPIPLQKTVITGISLDKANGNSLKQLIENLPNAPVSIINPDLNNNLIYSKIFIYV